jgi:cytochrome c-type biogenesis protein CcmH/NrfF
MGASPIKGKPMFDIEHYKKPTNWANVALWVVSVAAIVVVALDVFVWRP